MAALLQFVLVALVAFGGIHSTETHPKLRLALAGEKRVNDEYLVSLSKNDFQGSFEALENILEANGGRLQRKYVIGNAVTLLVRGPIVAMTLLADHPDVDMIEANRIVSVEKPVEELPGKYFKESSRPVKVEPAATGHPVCYTDVVGPDGWGIVRTAYHSKPDFDQDPYIWGEGDDGTGVDVYILDTGIRISHDDFKGRNVIWGFTANHSLYYEPEEDLQGHGTHVAGTAGGNRFGMARNSNLIAVKVHDQTGDGPISDVIEGLEWIVNDVADKKAQGKVTRSVINMSLGFGPSYLLENSMQATIDAGVLVVNSAGNSALDTCGACPGRMASVLSVAATNINDSLASFSNWGPCTDIMAPGRYIMSAGIQNDQEYNIKSGTSMAAPHVTGMVARYLSTLTDTEAAAITPEMITAHITDLGSRGEISLEDSAKQSTADRLLYKKCDRPNEEPVVAETTTTTTVSTSTSAAATTTTTKASATTTTTVTPPAQSMWSTDDLGRMTLAALVMSAIILTSSLTSLGLMFSSTAKL